MAPTHGAKISAAGQATTLVLLLATALVLCGCGSSTSQHCALGESEGCLLNNGLDAQPDSGASLAPKGSEGGLDITSGSENADIYVEFGKDPHGRPDHQGSDCRRERVRSERQRFEQGHGPQGQRGLLDERHAVAELQDDSRAVPADGHGVSRQSEHVDRDTADGGCEYGVVRDEPESRDLLSVVEVELDERECRRTSVAGHGIGSLQLGWRPTAPSRTDARPLRPAAD
jgi:hypothetical protein